MGIKVQHSATFWFLIALLGVLMVGNIVRTEDTRQDSARGIEKLVERNAELVKELCHNSKIQSTALAELQAAAGEVSPTLQKLVDRPCSFLPEGQRKRPTQTEGTSDTTSNNDSPVQAGKPTGGSGGSGEQQNPQTQNPQNPQGGQQGGTSDSGVGVGVSVCVDNPFAPACADLGL